MTNWHPGATDVARPPRVLHVPPDAVDTDGPGASFLSHSYGLTMDDWQDLTLDTWMCVRPSGKWAASRVGIAAPRQNGKNGALEARELYGLVSLGECILHTAHEVKTAAKAFRRLAAYFTNPRHPELAALVDWSRGGIRRANGQEAIFLTSGGSIEFIARSNNSARGFTADLLVMDEAQELADDVLAALLPTISASPLGNPQQIYLGTPPTHAGRGEVFWRVRRAGVAGDDPRLAWLEWSADGGVDLDDREVWAATNPALGTRLLEDTVASERGSMADATFGRERLGMWTEAITAEVIPSDTWDLLADEMSQPIGGLVLAADVAPDRASASLAVAGVREDGLWHVEVIENRKGTGWVASRASDVAARNGIRTVVIDGASPAATLVEGIHGARLKVVTTGVRDMAAACGGLYDAVMQGTLRHLADPRTDFALTQARRRRVLGGESWAWSRVNSEADITPVVALTLALWGAQSSRVRKRADRSARASSHGKVVVL